MKAMIAVVMLYTIVASSVPGQTGGGTSKSAPPVIDQTKQQMEQRIAAVKKRTGKTLDIKTMGKPVADPRDPKKRGIRCIQLSAYEWNLAFPEFFGVHQYGGTVCGRF